MFWATAAAVSGPALIDCCISRLNVAAPRRNQESVFLNYVDNDGAYPSGRFNIIPPPQFARLLLVSAGTNRTITTNLVAVDTFFCCAASRAKARTLQGVVPVLCLASSSAASPTLRQGTLGLLVAVRDHTPLWTRPNSVKYLFSQEICRGSRSRVRACACVRAPTVVFYGVLPRFVWCLHFCFVCFFTITWEHVFLMGFLHLITAVLYGVSHSFMLCRWAVGT